ncbi:hypothetical protein LCGC14_0495240 [marine sediment metagenome]|uniref:Uncharacterized protein n=1 Tax=marine sediment metagenome TaxID=412755 RepID=A0A0F9SNY3_9ZZZZ
MSNIRSLKRFCGGCKNILGEGEENFHTDCMTEIKKYFNEHKWGMFLKSLYGRLTLQFLVADIIAYGEQEVLLDHVNNPEIIGFIDYCKKNGVYKLENGSVQLNFLNYPGMLGESEFQPQEDDDNEENN